VVFAPPGGPVKLHNSVIRSASLAAYAYQHSQKGVIFITLGQKPHIFAYLEGDFGKFALLWPIRGIKT
jgi:hypothetical protein